MASILLIETATEVCSAAIAVDGEVVATAEDLHSQSHSALLTLQIEECVKMSGIALDVLDAVAVSQGPGSYTSLRVGASVAKGICYALDKPLIAIDTLLALAWASREISNQQSSISHSLFIPMLDARRQEVWAAVFDNSLRLLKPAQPLILENNLFENHLREIPEFDQFGVPVLSGNGSLKFQNVMNGEKVVFSQIKNCSARHLAALAEQFFQSAEFQNVAYFEPFYMKAPNITAPPKAPF